MVLTQEEMEKEGVETINVTMTFYKATGELKEISSSGRSTVNLGVNFTIDDLGTAGLKKFTLHTFLYGWGSPPCIVQQTRFGGYKLICFGP